MQEPKEAAAKTHAERGGGFHFPGKARIIQAQFAHRSAQLFEIAGVHWEQAAKDYWLDVLIAWQRVFGAGFIGCDRIPDRAIRDFLDRGYEEANLAWAQLIHIGWLGFKHANPVDIIGRAGFQHADLHFLFQHAIMHANDHHNPEIRIIIRVYQGGLKRRISFAVPRRWKAFDNRFKHILNAEAGLGRNLNRVRGIEADNVLNLCLDRVRIGGGQVDLVQDRNDLMVLIDGLVHICQRLRLNALARIHHEQRAFTGREAAADLIREVDMARRVHKVQRIGLAILGLIVQAHRLGLNRDTALFLNIH